MCRRAHCSNTPALHWSSFLAHVAQRRGSALKTRKVSVRARPWAPIRVSDGVSEWRSDVQLLAHDSITLTLHCSQFFSPCSPMQRRQAQTLISAGANPATGTILYFRLPICDLRLHGDSNRKSKTLRNVNRTSEPGLGANECVPSGKWCESTAFRHARVVQREPSAL